MWSWGRRPPRDTVTSSLKGESRAPGRRNTKGKAPEVSLLPAMDSFFLKQNARSRRAHIKEKKHTQHNSAKDQILKMTLRQMRHLLIIRNRKITWREETHSLESSLVMEANVNMSPPWGHRRALFPTDDTGLHLVGFLLKWDKEDQCASLLHE